MQYMPLTCRSTGAAALVLLSALHASTQDNRNSSPVLFCNKLEYTFRDQEEASSWALAAEGFAVNCLVCMQGKGKRFVYQCVMIQSNNWFRIVCFPCNNNHSEVYCSLLVEFIQ